MRDFKFGLPAQERLKGSLKEIFLRANLQLCQRTKEYGTITDLSCRLPVIAYEEQRQMDIITDMEKGRLDVGVIGSDVGVEYMLRRRKEPFYVSYALPVARCSFWFFTRADLYLKSITDLRGRLIVTSYPETLRQTLKRNNLGEDDVKIEYREGKIERAISRGDGEVGFDIVQSGSSLERNLLYPRLKKMEESSAQAIYRKDLSPDDIALAKAFCSLLTLASPYAGEHWPDRFVAPEMPEQDRNPCPQ